MPRDESDYRKRSAARSGPNSPTPGAGSPASGEVAVRRSPGPGTLQLVVVSPDDIDALMEKAQAISEGFTQRQGPIAREVGFEEESALDSVAPVNGNCPSCTTNGLC